MRRLPVSIFLAMLLGLGLCLGPPGASAQGPTEDNQLDLNRAALVEIMQLPISEEDARTIWEHREYRSYFESVYEIRKLPGFDQEKFERIKPLVRILPVPIEDEELRRVREIYYRIRRWEAEEGASEALVDHWMDLAKDPLDINGATYQQIANLQNVSPPDAAAIYNHIRKNRLSTRSELRNIPGLTYWGYYNTRNFVRYEAPEDDVDFRGSYQFRIYDTPSLFDVEECLAEDRNPADKSYDSWWDRLALSSAGPTYQHKFRGRWGRDIRAGALLYRGIGGGEPDAIKFNVTVKDKELGPLEVNDVVVGNYALTFGQGLVMQNTDFHKPRNSGFGWEQRYVGILGDISQTEEYQLKGIAADMSVGNVKGLLFFSDDWKDAVLNPDGTVNQYLLMSPRIDNDELTVAGLRRMKDILHETTYGANLRYMFGPGTWVGLSGFESRYNKYFKSAYDPDGTIDKTWMVPDEDEDKLTSADNEYFSSYTSPGKFRRIYGAEFQWVKDNISFAGEYAGLDKDGDLFDFSGDARAFILNGYASYSDLTLLGIYRDYDLDYDNPYNRGFSEYKRFKGTVLEDQYYLTDPVYGLLYDNSVTPQAERGFYLSTRYRFSHRLTPSFEYDVWERKADGADYSRLVLRLRFQPIYNIVMNLRHKWQGRLGTNILTPMSYDQVESRFRIEYRLSKFDEVEFLLSRAWIAWPPRPRLSDNVEPDGGHPAYGSAGEPSYAVGGAFTHNFSDWLVMSASFLYYDGFLWVFEDGSFTVTDGKAMRYWISIADKLSDHLAVRLRWTNDHPYPQTNLDARDYNENPPGNPNLDGWYVRGDTGSFRLQIDYSW